MYTLPIKTCSLVFLQPQPPVRSYPMEAIGPLSCTKDGVYLAGGALSGNSYIWEVSIYRSKISAFLY